MSFPRYPQYKDSGVEWLGKVPGHWHISKLKHFTHFVGGGTPSRDKLEFWNGDIPWVSPKDMKSERINGAEECITEEGLLGSSSSLIAEGRVLMVVRSGILKHTIPVAINDAPVALNQDMKALTFSREKCLSSFFWRWVQGLNDRLLLAWSKPGATVDSIEHDYLAETRIPLPPIDEQLQITLFLEHETTKIDDLMAEQEKLIALLKEKRQAVIAHAVTKGLDPTVPMKDSGVEWLGEVPAHWQIIPLKKLGRIQYGIGEPPKYQEDGTPLIRATNVGAGKLHEQGLVFVDPDDIPEKRIFWLEEGDIIVVRSGAYTGDSAIIPRGFGPCIAGFDMVFRPKNIVPDFIQFALLSRYLKEHQLDLKKTRAAQPHLNAEELGECYVLLPPPDEQKEICRALTAGVESSDFLVREAEHSIALLKERRTALISAAVTGQIDVRGLIKEEQEQAA